MGEFEVFELGIRSFGPNQKLAHTLLEFVQNWNHQGRPTLEQLRLRLYLKDSPYDPHANEIVIPKGWTNLIIDWA